MFKNILIAFYVGIKIYLTLIILGGVALYFLSPQFREFVLLSSSYREVLKFSKQIKEINLNVPLSTKEKLLYSLGFVLMGFWFINAVIRNHTGGSPLWMSDLSDLLQHRGFYLTGILLTQFARHSHLKRKMQYGQSQIREFMGRQEFFRFGKTVFTYSNAGIAFSALVTGITVGGVMNGVSDTLPARFPIQIGRALIGDISGAELANSLTHPRLYHEEYLRHVALKDELHKELIRKDAAKYYAQRETPSEIIEFDAVFEKRWKQMYFGRPKSE